MSAFPQLVEADLTQIEGILDSLLRRTEAKATILTDIAGFVVTSQGETDGLDLATLGALAANTYAASAAMAGMIGEPDFASLYQQGAQNSLLINALGQQALLTVVFDKTVQGGAVKHFTKVASGVLSSHLKMAAERARGQTVDFAMLNIADTGEIFRRRGA